VYVGSTPTCTMLTGADFTARITGTWAATGWRWAGAGRELEWAAESDANVMVVAMVKDVSKQLGNTSCGCERPISTRRYSMHFQSGGIVQAAKPRVRKGFEKPRKVAAGDVLVSGW